MQFFDELKRRNVFRVGAAYLVVAWLVLQVVGTVAPMLELPGSFGRSVLLLLAIGFPVALLFSWAYELTPEGVKKERDVERSASINHVTGRKLDRMIIGVLSIAVVYFAIDKFVWTESDTRAITEGETVAAADNSPTRIAVLPFVNMSDDPEQEYFSDGLSEELLNLLARIPELRVTSRTSAFSFKDKDFTIAEVGEQLGVVHVLEGSVRRSGDTIRVTAQLIDVASDTHQWSETWDRKFEDVFVIQDEIAAHVVDALRLELLDDIPRTEETTPEVYAMVLQSSFLLRQGNAPSLRQAEEVLKQAIELDPGYSQAWSQLALNYYAGASMGLGDPVERMPLVHEAIDQTLSLDPKNALAHILRAQIAYSYDYDFELAEAELAIAEEHEPWNSQIQALASRLAFAQGDLQQAVEHNENAHQLDPLAGHRNGAAMIYYLAGYREDALQYLEEGAELHPFGARTHSVWARVLVLEGDSEGALALLENEVSDGHQANVRALAYQAMGDTVRAREEVDKLLALGDRWTYELAETYAYLGEADEAFAWFDRAIERRDTSLTFTVADPFLDGIRDDPRFDRLLTRLGRNSTL